MINFYNHQYADPIYWIDRESGKHRLANKKAIGNCDYDFEDYRLIQRRVARQSDSRTLILSIIPPNKFCDNSVNYGVIQNGNKTDLLFILALFSSFIVDYQVRSRLNSNITIGLINQLFIPRLQKGDQWFSEIVERAAKLICTTPEFDDLATEVGLTPDPQLLPEVGDLNTSRYGVTDEAERGKLRAELDGIIAHLYGLTETEFKHILRVVMQRE